MSDKLDVLETGHFTWEDGAEDYLQLTSDWISAHRKRWPRALNTRAIR